MMRLQTYAGFSFLAMISVLYHAFNSRGQFYPAMVYLSTCKICFVLLLNMGLVLMCIFWQLVKCLFLGTLREAEVERLNEQLWREIMEVLFAITIFRQEFSVTTLAMVTALLMIKSLHWLTQKRVEYIETTPSVSLHSHVRIVSFMVFLLVVDYIFLRTHLQSFVQTWKASVALFFSFEYTILASTIISTLVKYGFYVKDAIMEGQWEKKAVYTFYLELIRDLFNLSMYIVFFLFIFAHYGVPLHLIRELYETFRSFRIRVADYIRYRKVTSNVDERFPNATPDELNSSDATCIICREEMVTAKKLLCGHLFHVHCLRSWLERQNTCPTCRASVIPLENGTGGSGQQAGAIVATTSTQGSEDGQGTGNLSPHQARVKAASLAASLYEKSFVCSPINAYFGSSGFSFSSHRKITEASTSSSQRNESAGEPSVSGSPEQQLFPGTYPHILMPAQTPGSSFVISHTSVGNPDPKVSLLACEAFIRAQIEILESELRTLQKQKDQPEGSRGDADCAISDVKGKAVADIA